MRWLGKTTALFWNFSDLFFSLIHPFRPVSKNAWYSTRARPVVYDSKVRKRDCAPARATPNCARLRTMHRTVRAPVRARHVCACRAVFFCLLTCILITLTTPNEGTHGFLGHVSVVKVPKQTSWTQERTDEKACFLTSMKIGDPNTGYLGNQIFQIASMIGIAENLKLPWKFPAKINTTRVGLLFELEGEYIDPKNIEKYEEKNLNFHQVQLGECSKSGVSLEGYFQSPKYFENSLATLRKVLTINKSFLDRIAEQIPAVTAQNSVTVHVRRGDYTGLTQVYSLPSVEYYQRALSRLNSVDTVIIISDDIEWCKKNLGPALPHEVLYSPFRDELSDFVLLLLGKHSVLANSSFSWWSAYLKMLLNIHRGSQVVAPRPWYNPSGVNSYANTDSFYPPWWTILDI